MPSPRDVLNKLRYTGLGLDEVEIAYRHRGAPNDTRVVRGEDVRYVDRGWLRIGGARGGSSIPWHRVLRIERRGEVLFAREGR